MFNSPSPQYKDDVIFNSCLLVNQDDESRKSCLRLQIHRLPSEPLSYMYPSSEVIRIQISDDNDPFLAFSADMNDEVFQRLKVEQQLLIDFASFPQRLVDLLRSCGDENPLGAARYRAELRSDRLTSAAHLDITEINGFKKILHLSLRLIKADDGSLKQHLRNTIIRLQKERAHFEGTLKSQEMKLREQQSIHESQMENLRRKFEYELQLKSQQGVHQRIEQFGQNDFEATLKDRIRCLEGKLTDSEMRTAKSEARIRELMAENQQLTMDATQEKETNRIIQERLDCLQRTDPGKENADFRLKIAQMKVEIETLKTELCKVDMEKKRLEETAKLKQGQLERREAGIKTMSEDILKANDIIQKLQAEIKTYHSKLKVRSDVIAKQEEIIDSKEKEISNMRSRGDQMNCENLKVGQLEKQIEHKDNVIQWLNKKLNEFQGHKIDTPLMSAPSPLNEINGQPQRQAFGRHLSNRPK